MAEVVVVMVMANRCSGGDDNGGMMVVAMRMMGVTVTGVMTMVKVTLIIHYLPLIPQRTEEHIPLALVPFPLLPLCLLQASSWRI